MEVLLINPKAHTVIINRQRNCTKTVKKSQRYTIPGVKPRPLSWEAGERNHCTTNTVKRYSAGDLHCASIRPKVCTFETQWQFNWSIFCFFYDLNVVSQLGWVLYAKHFFITSVAFFLYTVNASIKQHILLRRRMYIRNIISWPMSHISHLGRGTYVSQFIWQNSSFTWLMLLWNINIILFFC